MTNKSWKAVERAIGRYLHTDRTGALVQDNADLHSDIFSFEVKSRKNPMKTLVRHLGQAKRNAMKGGRSRIPVVIIHPDNGRHERDHVIMELKDFKYMAEKAKMLDNSS